MVMRTPGLCLVLVIGCSADHRTAREVPMDNSHATKFSIGPLVALDGGDGEAVAAAGSLIATFGAARATWWAAGPPRTAALPDLRVRGARFSQDGRALLVGTGRVDLASGAFAAHPAVAGLVDRGPPGGGLAIQATSWSGDGRHVAVLQGWSGPRTGAVPASRVVVLDVARPDDPAVIPADGATAVRIAGDRVVIAAEDSRVFDLAGAQIAALPKGHGAPIRLSGGDAGPVFLVEADFSLRVVDPATGAVRATWPGPVLDAVAVPGGLVAIDLEGRLHAGCLGAGGVAEAGTAETGVRNAQLAATGDGRLVILGAGAEPVHTATFQLRCGS